MRLTLWAKVLLLSLLNLALLAAALVVIVRVQFRLDPGSFLLAPAQSRIMSVSQTLALELGETNPAGWDDLLARYSQVHGVSFLLFEESGERTGAPGLSLPREVAEKIPGDYPIRENRPKGEKRKATKGGPRPPLFLTATANPTQYWAGVRVPVRRPGDVNPHPGTLILTAPSLLASSLFFDPTPWLTIGLAVIAVSVLCWLPFIRGLTQSITAMNRAASRIAEGHFEAHAAARRRDELGELGDTIDRMATRLSGFVNGQKRFLGGIAHELSNPIATIQFGLGNLERRVPEEQREAVADIQEEAQHISMLVNELLSFSRAGLQAIDRKLVAVNVAATVDRAIEREAAPGAEILNAVDTGVQVMADPEYLFRAISNVLRNAVRYAGEAGPIVVSARTAENAVFLSIADRGPGVPEESLEEIFAPFYRLDASRNQATGGTGLGLAIVKTCVESCGGSVCCRNRQPSGLEVEIRLNAAKG